MREIVGKTVFICWSLLAVSLPSFAHITNPCNEEHIFVSRVESIQGKMLPEDQHVWNFRYCAKTDCDPAVAPRLGVRAYDGRELLEQRKFLEGLLNDSKSQLLAMLLTGGLSFAAIPRINQTLWLLTDELAQSGELEITCPLSFKRRLNLLDGALREIDARGDGYGLRAGTRALENEASFAKFLAAEQAK
jgi:hypothetical protein